MDPVDPERVAALIRSVAETAILPRFRNLAADDVKSKGPNDLVTVADTEAERALGAGLAALLPGSAVVGEEGVAADAAALAPLAGDGATWILDPLDGTLAFVRGEPDFSMIVALAEGGRTVAGWIYDPLRRRMAVAEAGKGARLDGAPMRVAPDRPVAELAGAVWWRPAARKLGGKVRETRPWASAGLAYLALAEGKLDFALFRRLKPWDHAAGVLIHAEAGGTSALLDGAPYRPVPLEIPLLMAPGPESWAELKALVAD